MGRKARPAEYVIAILKGEPGASRDRASPAAYPLTRTIGSPQHTRVPLPPSRTLTLFPQISQ